MDPQSTAATATPVPASEPSTPVSTTPASEGGLVVPPPDESLIPPPGATPDPDPQASEQEEVIDEKPQSILLGLMKQLTVGMDLTRVTLPTFVLEPRSLLERYTDFLTHADFLLRAINTEDPIQRMIEMCKWYVSGFHIRPKGVKKPYNPVLGEIFRCHWDHRYATRPDLNSTTTYIAEQVSHHPPVTAFYFDNRKSGFVINGQCYTKSKFLGNSAAALMEGSGTVYMINRNEQYICNFPSAYVRGIIIGKMCMEMCGDVTITCPQTHLQFAMEFKPKSFWGGRYNEIAGKLRTMNPDGSVDLKSKKCVIATMTGNWASTVHIQRVDIPKSPSQVLFDAATSVVTPKIVAPEDQQLPFESRRLWTHVTRALKARDMDAATAAKTANEDAQRQGVRERAERHEEWRQRHFHLDPATGLWVFNQINTAPYDPRESDASPTETAVAAATAAAVAATHTEGLPAPTPAPNTPSEVASPSPSATPAS
eukprot:GAFH01001388.1.p1 GENE.GAFH01001388.1~~GAFH01001388.1.p1  ORF type:complete len:494 (-),score=159.26 GAFH01001388.1:190-1635(-)